MSVPGCGSSSRAVSQGADGRRQENGSEPKQVAILHFPTFRTRNRRPRSGAVSWLRVCFGLYRAARSHRYATSMSKRVEIKYRRLSNSSDDNESPEPGLAFAGGRGAGERIPLVERRAVALYGPSSSVASGGSSGSRGDSTLLRARGGDSGATAPLRQSPKPDDLQTCFERDINPGETLTSISVQYSCPVALLKQVNHLVADQEFYGLKVIRVPIKKYGLLSELLALESAENRLRAVGGAAGGSSSQPASVHDSRSCNGVHTEPTTCQQQPLREVRHGGLGANALEPNSPSSCSDPSDYECDTNAADLARDRFSYLPVDDDPERVTQCDGGGTRNAAFSEFLRAKDAEIKSIAERVDSAIITRTPNDAAALMRASPTFPLQIQRTRHNSGTWSKGARWAVASVAGFVVAVVLLLVGILPRMS